MRFDELKQSIGQLLTFDKNALRAFEKRPDALDANLRYWLKKGGLLALKKGLYILKETVDNAPDRGALLEYVANQLVRPSYLSAEYVLAKYQILSEAVTAVTSITVKSTRVIANPLGVFRYYSIAPKLFSGFEARRADKKTFILEAGKGKALFDFLYLRFAKSFSVSEASVRELRLNWENISRDDFQNAAAYAVRNGLPRMKKLFNVIKKMYYA